MRLFRDINIVQFVLPVEHHRISIDLIEILVDAVSKLLFGFNPNTPKHLLGHFAEETFYHVEPGTMLRSKHEFESSRDCSKESPCFLGCMSRMVIQYQTDLVTLGIFIVKDLQEINEI